MTNLFGEVPPQVCLAQHWSVCILLAHDVLSVPSYRHSCSRGTSSCDPKACALLPQARSDTAIYNEGLEQESKLVLQAHGKLKVRTFWVYFQVACLVEFVKAFSTLALDAIRSERKLMQSLTDTVGHLHKRALFLSTKVMPGRSAIYMLSLALDVVVFVKLTASRSGTVCICR